MSRGPIPDYPVDRPKVPEVAARIRKIYDSEDGGAGCCLHVLTDDGNFDSADWCMKRAHERGHTFCEETALMLTKMTPSQVRRAVARGTNWQTP